MPNGNFNSFKAEMTGLAEGRVKFTRFWNSETRFVVAGANEFSMLQQTEIFDYFSKFRMYNCIIISRESYVIDEEYNTPIKFNDVDTNMKLGVYTWFPYQSSDRCTEVNDITLLDSWVISVEGHFTKNTDLFSGKIGNRFNGCPMKSLVSESQWDYSKKYVPYSESVANVGSYMQALEYDLLMVVLEQMNMSLRNVPTPENFKKKGENLFTNLVIAMLKKEIYIHVGNGGTNYLPASYFDSTNSYYKMSVRWYVPCSVKYPRWSSIFRILSVDLWLVLIISIVIAAISTTLVGRYSCTSEWQGYKTLTSSLFIVCAIILGVSVSTMPRTPSNRSLFLSWLCFSVSFNTVFQAFLTTFLIDSGYETPIQNMDELIASGIKLVYLPEFNIIFKNGDETEASTIKRLRVDCSPYEVCLDWAKYQKNVSVLLIDKFAEDSYAIGDFVGENSEPLLCSLEDGVVYTFGLSMIMFHGDPLMKRVTEIIDRVFEAGLYNYWNSLNMNFRKLYSRNIAAVHPLDGYYSFNLYHMQPAFYLFLMGLCLSVLCFMAELLCNCLFTKSI